MDNLFRKIPKIDKIIELKQFDNFNKKVLTEAIRENIDFLRKQIKEKKINDFKIDALIEQIKRRYFFLLKPSLKPLINATGIILHTNMGRSLISKELLENASKVICNYSNLEYNIQTGKRGQRYDHAREDLSKLLNVEDVLVVNNNASAVFLILNTFAKNKEVIVSRGELVEIGGSFRIPEVMKESGAILKEIGTTNKTKLTDYKQAITDNTAMLMKVHKSNFSIEGFSEEVDFQEIEMLSKENNLIDYYDLGSGYIPKLPYNLGQKEPPLSKLTKTNPSLISFSGDKLFGSAQAGIIAGKKKYIDKLKQNQLLRMLRVDKITLSILEETAKAYLKEDYEKIPTLYLLNQTTDSLVKRAKEIQKNIGKQTSEILETWTYMGGGTLPNRKFPTISLHIKGDAINLEKKFREKGLIGRIENDMFLIDFRSILPSLDNKITIIIEEVINQ